MTDLSIPEQCILVNVTDTLKPESAMRPDVIVLYTDCPGRALVLCPICKATMKFNGIQRPIGSTDPEENDSESPVYLFFGCLGNKDHYLSFQVSNEFFEPNEKDFSFVAMFEAQVSDETWLTEIVEADKRAADVCAVGS